MEIDARFTSKAMSGAASGSLVSSYAFHEVATRIEEIQVLTGL